ncbi:hypothetical protein GCM10010124_00680 [Pilimelia terevasa]|uniref:Uncharacterized protein n=1 Tax=Pilimelia terevasa TaxID=53372 RepID=A0A8J3BCS7_9ACTN|nr:hypothetical protein [Pilimelia terevasa]GGK11925.1 hypothetical protein GCM10010124_00680 [Pilimelia terevasa]
MIGQLAARLLRSRYGIAACLAAVVVGVLATTSFVAPADDLTPEPAVAPITTVHPSVGDDGESAPPTPTLAALPGASPPDAVARRFAAAWLSGARTPAGWQGRLGPLVTADLADRLADADPGSVPATALADGGGVTALGAELAEATVPTAAGLLRLRLRAADGRWLVDAVDWEQA